MILEVVSPESVLFNGEVISVSLPGVDGSFQVLNNHAPIVSILKRGTVTVTAKGYVLNKDVEKKFTKVSDQVFTLQILSGTIEMKDNKTIVLAD